MTEDYHYIPEEWTNKESTEKFNDYTLQGIKFQNFQDSFTIYDNEQKPFMFTDDDVLAMKKGAGAHK